MNIDGAKIGKSQLHFRQVSHKDWCHTCGKRSTNMYELYWPENAEHNDRLTNYLRICDSCLANIVRARSVVEAAYWGEQTA